MDDSGETYTIANFRLESGKVIDQVDVRYRTWGELNDTNNALVVCHALTEARPWTRGWGDLLGPGLPFDTNKYFVVCANVLGSCYGSTGPTSINPKTGSPMVGTFHMLPFVIVSTLISSFCNKG